MIDLAMVLVLVGQMGTEGSQDVRPPDVRFDAWRVQPSAQQWTLPQVLPAQPRPLDERAAPREHDERAWRCPIRIVPADPRVDPGMIKTIDPRDAQRHTVRVVPPRCRP